jgi:hypothetical protein
VITLAVSGGDFGFKGVNAIWNEGGNDQSTHGVGGIRDDDLIVVRGERVINYPSYSGVLTTINGCVLEVLGGPLVDAPFVIVTVGVFVCIRLIGLRGVSGGYWARSSKGFHLLTVGGHEGCEELAVDLVDVGLLLLRGEGRYCCMW